MTDGTEKATKSQNISHRDVSCVRRCVCLWLASWWCSCQFDSAIRQLKSVYRFTVYRRGQHEYIHWPWDSCGFVLFFHSYGAATACMSQMKSINTTFPFVWLELCFISHRFIFFFHGSSNSTCLEIENRILCAEPRDECETRILDMSCGCCIIWFYSYS